jgi:hypothetical protein
MSISRKKAIKRLEGLAGRVEEHLVKLHDFPGDESAPHWKRELNGWVRQMEEVLPCLGKKTAEAWAKRFSDWKARIEGQ